MKDERKRILIIFLVSLRVLLTISYLFLSPLVAVAMVAR